LSFILQLNLVLTILNEFPHDVFTQEEKELYLKIKARKEELEDDLVILAHHYQSKWITELGDFVLDFKVKLLNK